MAKRSSSSKECDNLPVSPSSASPPTKMSSTGLGRREPCSSCGQPVYLAQRLLVDGRLYHRTCFKCARCGAQLTLAGCYQTETDGQYCCETCPDEENDTPDCRLDGELPDEKGDVGSLKEYSQKSIMDDERAEYHRQKEITKPSVSSVENGDQILGNITNTRRSAFTGFMSSQISKRDSDDEDVVVPALPKSLPPSKPLPSNDDIIQEDTIETSEHKKNKCLNNEDNPSGADSQRKDNVTSLKDNLVSATNDDFKPSSADETLDIAECKNSVLVDSVSCATEEITSVSTAASVSKNIRANKNENKSFDQREDIDHSQIMPPTDDSTSINNAVDTNFQSTEQNVSLVKMRMQIFENANKHVEPSPKINEKITADEKTPLDQKLSVDVNVNKDSTSADKDSFNKLSEFKELESDDSQRLETDKTAVNIAISNIESHHNVPYENVVPSDNTSTTSNVDDSDLSKKNNIDIEDDELKRDEENDPEPDEDCGVKVDDTIEATPKVPLPDEKEEAVSDGIEETVPQNENIESSEEINSKSNENIKPNDISTESIKDNKNDSKCEYPDHLNPFSDDEDDDDETNKLSTKEKRESLNPFDSCSDEEENNTPINTSDRRKSKEKPPRPPLPAILINANKINNSDLKKVVPPSGSFNPFSSDEDETSDEEMSHSLAPIPAPRQRVEEESTSLQNVQHFYGSSSSLTSTISRKKKPAPKPPVPFDNPVPAPRSINTESSEDPNNLSIISHLSSPASSVSQISPQISPRARKRRPAPLPPSNGGKPTATSTMIGDSLNCSMNYHDDSVDLTPSMISETEDKQMSLTSIQKKIISAADFDNDPDISLINDVCKEDIDVASVKKPEDIDKNLPPLNPDKSTTGQWKRRKGPAPAIPLFQKRATGPPIPPAVIRRELQLLEAQQRGLERQGVRLEELIREKCETNNPDGENAEPDPETDELVLQLFELVNEKNELFRRQTELMYIRRQQRLEEEYADLDHQIRILMSRPEVNKTDSDKAKEEQLIQRLLEVVERRDEVITRLEMDRLREKEEDKCIRERMASHRAKRDENSSLSSMDVEKNPEKKDKKKEKRRWLRKDKNKSSDNVEINPEDSIKQTVKKEKKHKKWF